MSKKPKLGGPFAGLFPKIAPKIYRLDVNRREDVDVSALEDIGSFAMDDPTTVSSAGGTVGFVVVPAEKIAATLSPRKLAVLAAQCPDGPLPTCYLQCETCRAIALQLFRYRGTWDYFCEGCFDGDQCIEVEKDPAEITVWNRSDIKGMSAE